MREEVIQKAEAHLNGMVVLDPGQVTITQNPSTVEVRYKESVIELPMSPSVTEDAARYLIGAAVYADSRQNGHYLYSGAWID